MRRKLSLESDGVASVTEMLGRIEGWTVGIGSRLDITYRPKEAIELKGGFSWMLLS